MSPEVPSPLFVGGYLGGELAVKWGSAEVRGGGCQVLFTLGQW